MVPVISNLADTTGIALPVLAWTLALGTDIGGNATPIGASANAAGTAIAERDGYPNKMGPLPQLYIAGNLNGHRALSRFVALGLHRVIGECFVTAWCEASLASSYGRFAV